MAGVALSIQRSSSDSRQAAKSCITTSQWLSSCSQSPAGEGEEVYAQELYVRIYGVGRQGAVAVQLLPVACRKREGRGGRGEGDRITSAERSIKMW